MVRDLGMIHRAPLPRRRSRPIRRRKTIGAKRREVKALGWVDPDSWQEVLAFYRYGCAYCSVEFWDHQDHCKPISRGGCHDISNVVPTCAKCNYAKGTKTRYPERRHPFMEKP